MFMAILIILWPYLLTIKLRSVIRHNLGHSKDTILVYMLCAIFINHNFSSFSQPQKLIAMNGARDYKLQLL